MTGKTYYSNITLSDESYTELLDYTNSLMPMLIEQFDIYNHANIKYTIDNYTSLIYGSRQTGRLRLLCGGDLFDYRNGQYLDVSVRGEFGSAVQLMMTALFNCSGVVVDNA